METNRYYIPLLLPVYWIGNKVLFIVRNISLNATRWRLKLLQLQAIYISKSDIADMYSHLSSNLRWQYYQYEVHNVRLL